jgi:hypothetical protein
VEHGGDQIIARLLVELDRLQAVVKADVAEHPRYVVAGHVAVEDVGDRYSLTEYRLTEEQSLLVCMRSVVQRLQMFLQAVDCYDHRPRQDGGGDHYNKWHHR